MRLHAFSASGTAKPRRDDTLADHLHRDIVERGVLLVEDCPAQRALAADLLRAAGVDRVIEASDGVHALLAFGRMHPAPAIVVLDINLPRMDGFDALRLLAERGSRPAVLVVSGCHSAVLDAMGTLAQELDIAWLGAVPKPLASAALRQALARYQARPAADVPGGFGSETPRRALETALRQGRIGARYQPKLRLADGACVGLEALLHCEGQQETGALDRSDGVARPALEDELALGLLDAVLGDLRRIDGVGHRPSVSFHLSSTSLGNRALHEVLGERVRRAGVAPDRLLLEISEAVLAFDPDAAHDGLGRLRARGFGIAIADYGTGLSSLQQLARLAPTELKIDRSLVRRAAQEGPQVVLASAIDVGRRLGARTVAPGVDSRHMLAALSRLGCDIGQGEALASPLAPDRWQAWRRDSHPQAARLCRELTMT